MQIDAITLVVCLENLGFRIKFRLEERRASIHERCQNNEDGSHDEKAARFEVVEDEIGEDGGEDDRDGGRKAFQNAVRVLDGQGHDQSSESLEQN